ncbi:MAG: glycosyltransferase [Marinilabiliaceae bacterium]
MPLISFIVPVYNRPQEVDELLESLSLQTHSDFEVLIVEDGSYLSCHEIADHWSEKLPVRYIVQENAGPGPARNTGASEATGEWLVFLDSDVVLPSEYTSTLAEVLQNASFDCFGGPDRPHQHFNATRKAIGHVMSSILTTGGIRGGQEKMDKFYPRSFNLGIRQEVFQKIGGFSNMRYGEDLDLSMRLVEEGYKTRLIRDAWVWHNRRNNFASFFKQVFHSGEARIELEKRHPGTLKAVHILPSLFAAGYPLLILFAIFWTPLFIFVLLPPFLFFMDALITLRNLKASFLAVPAAFTQLYGYGLGFIHARVKKNS